MEIVHQNMPVRFQEQLHKQFAELFANHNIQGKTICTNRRLSFVGVVPTEFTITYPKIRGPLTTAEPIVIEKFQARGKTVIEDGRYYVPELRSQLSAKTYLEQAIHKILADIRVSVGFKHKGVFWIRPVINLSAMLDDQVLSVQWGEYTANNQHTHDDLKVTMLNHAQEYDTSALTANNICEHPATVQIDIRTDLRLDYAQAALHDIADVCDMNSDGVLTVTLTVTDAQYDLKMLRTLLTAKLQDLSDLYQRDLLNHTEWFNLIQSMPFESGTMQDKLERIGYIYPSSQLRYLKADLCSLTVQEHPSLAKVHIKHLLHVDWPIELDILDDLDTLVQLAKRLRKFNSSEDPYGCKKFAQNIINLGCNTKHTLSDLPILLQALNADDVTDIVHDFLLQRLKSRTGCIFSSQNFWTQMQLADTWKQCTQKDLVLKTYKRLVNFIQGKQIVQELDERIEANKMLIEIRDNLTDFGQLIHVSQQLDAFFNNNMVLEQSILEQRLKILWQLQQLFQKYVPSDGSPA